jgi:hypothetical protein
MAEVQPGEERVQFVVRRVDADTVVVEPEWSEPGAEGVFTGVPVPLPALGPLGRLRVGDRLELRVLPRPGGGGGRR